MSALGLSLPDNADSGVQLMILLTILALIPTILILMTGFTRILIVLSFVRNAVGLQQMLELGEHCSMTERRADEAVRDAVEWLKCEFMLDKVGQVFEHVAAEPAGAEEQHV